MGQHRIRLILLCLDVVRLTALAECTAPGTAKCPSQGRENAKSCESTVLLQAGIRRGSVGVSEEKKEAASAKGAALSEVAAGHASPQQASDVLALTQRSPVSAATTLQMALDDTLLKNASARHALLLGLALAIGLVVFEALHFHCLSVDLHGPFAMLRAVRREQNRAREGPLQGAARLWTLYMMQRAGFGLSCVALIGSMIGMSQYANLLLVQWSNDFWGALPEWTKGQKGSGSSHWYEFEALLIQFLIYALMSLFASAYQYYVIAMFSITVREAVTKRYTSKWLSGFSSYRLELSQQGGENHGADNPDQRIQEDVRSFISTSVSLSVGLVNSISQFLIFSVQVYMLSPEFAFGIDGLRIPGWLLWVSVAYAASSTYLTMLTSRSLEALESTNQRSEANFRFELATVRRRAEAIALGRSEAVHLQRLDSRFGVLRRSIWESMLAQKRYLVVSNFFAQVEAIVPLLLLGPSFLAGGMNLGQLMSASRCMGLLDSSLLWLATSYSDVAEWRASTGRLVRFEDAITAYMKDSSGGAEVQETSVGSSLSIKGLTVWRPHEQARKDVDCAASEDDQEQEEQALQEGEGCRVPLFEELALDFAPGSRILLQGPSGTGKSTLLRALSGAWPFATGQVQVPGCKHQVLTFPAEVYVPAGELREAACYPSLPDGKAGLGDSEIQTALRLVGLGELLHGEADEEGTHQSALGRVQDWDLTLSSGQKARLSLARLVLQRPAFAALDEPVAHLQGAARAPLLRCALEALDPQSVVVVVSHDMSPDLMALFDTCLSVDKHRKTLTKAPCRPAPIVTNEHPKSGSGQRTLGCLTGYLK